MAQRIRSSETPSPPPPTNSPERAKESPLDTSGRLLSAKQSELARALGLRRMQEQSEDELRSLEEQREALVSGIQTIKDSDDYRTEVSERAL